MLIYIVLVFFLLGVGKLNISFVIGKTYNKGQALQKTNSSDRFKYFLWFISLTLISGLRGESVGTDTFGYLTIFRAQNGLGYGNVNQEILFQYLCKAIGVFTTNPQWLLIISSAIINACTLYYIRRTSEDESLSVFFFVALYYYFLAMNGTRQFIAISLLLVATIHAKERNLKLFFVFYVLAVGFHTTAIIGIVIWFIFRPKPTFVRNIYIASIMALIVFGFSYVQQFVAKYLNDYSILISGSKEYSPGIMMPIVYSIVFFAGLFVAIIDEDWRKDQNNMAVLSMLEIAMLWGMSTFILTNISSNIAQRIGWYFQIYSIIIIPNLLKSKVFKSRILLSRLLFMLVGFAHLIYFLSKGWHRVVPYYFFFK